jgi:NAD(P)-dependent dehydrogenase (short-subunit alcohol dehydrogenase family)
MGGQRGVDGRVAVVTGGGGIGAATPRALHSKPTRRSAMQLGRLER